jgi:hypothetical protein
MAAQLYSFSVAGMMELQQDVAQRGKSPAKRLHMGRLQVAWMKPE